MQNLTVQKVVLALITLGFFIGSPWLISETLGGNTLPLVGLGAVAVLLLFVYGLGDRCWLIIPFCLPVEGNLNFLPLNFSIQELAVLTVFGYLLLRMIFGLDVAWKLGPAILWIPLSGVLAVVLYHWISSGDIGIKLLGGTGWGGRRYFKVVIGALSIPLLASFPGIRWPDLQKVPFVYFLGSFVDIVPDLLTYFIPALAPYVWRVYSGVNLAEFGQTLRGNFAGEQGIGRVGTLAKLGVGLGLVTLCYFPARTWLNPARLWVLPLILVGGLLCALSGFRNSVFRYGFAVLAGLFASLRFKTLLLIPLVAGALFAVVFAQGKIFHLPLAMQRALSFLPGDWDAKAKREASGSSDWRQEIKDLFYKEYFPKNPVLGVGYHFDPELAKRDTDIYLSVATRRAEAGDEFARVRSFVEQRMPHEGPVHVLLVTGLVGMVFFVGFCAVLLLFAFGSVLRTPASQTAPIQVWAVALLLPQVLGFFIVFGDLTSFLIQTCPVAALLFRADRLKALAPPTPAPESPAGDPAPPPSPPWPAPAAAWHLRQTPLG